MPRFDYSSADPKPPRHIDRHTASLRRSRPVLRPSPARSVRSSAAVAMRCIRPGSRNEDPRGAVIPNSSLCGRHRVDQPQEMPDARFRARICDRGFEREEKCALGFAIRQHEDMFAEMLGERREIGRGSKHEVEIEEMGRRLAGHGHAPENGCCTDPILLPGLLRRLRRQVRCPWTPRHDLARRRQILGRGDDAHRQLSSRPRISISRKGQAPRSTPAWRATMSETTSCTP